MKDTSAILTHSRPSCLRTKSQSSSRINNVTTRLTMLTTSAPHKAGQKPSTTKVSPTARLKADVSNSITALMTSVSSPSVKMMNGQVSSASTGRMTAFTKPNTSATPNTTATLSPSWMPGTTRAATYNASALMSKRNNSLCIVHRLFDIDFDAL